MALQTYPQQVHAGTGRSRSRSEISSKWKVSRISIVQVAGAQAFCLGALALILTLPCNCGVRATTFAISGFNERDVYVVGDSSWILNSSAQCFYGSSSGAGRFLHPGLVQMKDPGATTVKSFSTSFIYRLLSRFSSFKGPGMALIIVPDNVTIRAPEGYMGVITADTPATSKKYESDSYTFAVELDSQTNKMFDDINDNHIGVNLASMNSSHTIKPDLILASKSTDLYQQIWIEYSEATSTMDIYSGYYGQGKPDKPQGSQLLVNLSYLKESMYIGFSASMGSGFTPTVYAWKFSNDVIPAPPIYIGQEAPPAAPPPPPGVSHPPTPGPGPQEPPPSTAKAPPPPSPVPPTPSPTSSNPPPLGISLPPDNSPNPFNPPSFSPSIAPQDPNSGHAAPPTRGPGGKKQWTRFGIPLTVAGIVVIIIWWLGLRRPFRVFISNTGGEDGEEKNFPLRLHENLKRYWWFMVRFRSKVFINKEDLRVGLPFPTEIFRELGRSDLGIVVVTDEYFRKKWPMTELIALVKAEKKQPKSNRRTLVLRLFYELTPTEVRQKAGTGDVAGIWEVAWEKMAQGDNPLEVEKCRAAVKYLNELTGVEYKFTRRDGDKEHLKSVIEEVDKILCKERSCASGFWWAVPACIQCRRTPVQSCAEPQIPMTDLQSNRDAGEGGIERQLHNIDDQEIQADCSRHGQSAADRLHQHREQR